MTLIFKVGFAQQNVEHTDSVTTMKKPNILGLRTTIYKVGDIDKAKEWYSKAFGIEAYIAEPFYVGFNIAGYELGLQPEDKPTTEKTESVVSYWGVEEIEKIYTHFPEDLPAGPTHYTSEVIKENPGEIFPKVLKEKMRSRPFYYRPLEKEFKVSQNASNLSK